MKILELKKIIREELFKEISSLLSESMEHEKEKSKDKTKEAEESILKKIKSKRPYDIEITSKEKTHKDALSNLVRIKAVEHIGGDTYTAGDKFYEIYKQRFDK